MGSKFLNHSRFRRWCILPFPSYLLSLNFEVLIGVLNGESWGIESKWPCNLLCYPGHLRVSGGAVNNYSVMTGLHKDGPRKSHHVWLLCLQDSVFPSCFLFLILIIITVFKIKAFFVRNSFRFIAKLRGKYRDFLCTLCPTHVSLSRLSVFLTRVIPFVTSEEPTLTHSDIYSLCRIFSVFNQQD